MHMFLIVRFCRRAMTVYGASDPLPSALARAGLLSRAADGSALTTGTTLRALFRSFGFAKPPAVERYLSSQTSSKRQPL